MQSWPPIDNIFAPKIELAIRSINTSSGRDLTGVSANSERREHAGINAFFENASKNNNKLNTTNENDETRRNIHDEVSELSVPGTHFDRQPHTHHTFLRISPPGVDYPWFLVKCMNSQIVIRLCNV